MHQWLPLRVLRLYPYASITKEKKKKVLTRPSPKIKKKKSLRVLLVEPARATVDQTQATRARRQVLAPLMLPF